MQLDVFMAEIFGTMILILLGDGVVAGVLLAKSKANASGWIVITFAWAMAVFAALRPGVVVARAVQRRPPQPGGDPRPLVNKDIVAGT